ncbi:MAG: gliding motility protein GldM [Cyclobacteriaceae bacterium]|nr:gliding motility protein GldM [Cyclobacteriaceae bacterium]
MAGVKETPRQKMIGMMYLVLTALLALNVSNTVLEKFLFMNRTMEQSVDDGGEKNGGTVARIESTVKESGERAKDLAVLTTAQEVRIETSKVLATLDELKKRMIEETGSYEEDGITPKGIKNMEKIAHMMIKQGEGKKLQGLLNDYTTFLTGKTGHEYGDLALDGKDHPIFKQDKNARKRDFATLQFDQTPMVAGLATISQFQTEIISRETDALEELARQVGAEDLKFDQINLVALPNSRVVAAGAKYEADLFIAASSSAAENPAMTFNGKEIEVISGKGKIAFTASGGGYDKDGIAKKSYIATVELKDSVYRDTIEYFVAKPVIQVQSASVQALYLNCGNELQINCPQLGSAYSPSFTASGAQTIRGAKTGQITVVPNAAEVKLNVYNSGNLLGTENFRVKRIPKPTIKLYNRGKEVNVKQGENISALRQINIKAIPDESFKTFLPKDARYRVTGWELTLARGKRPVAPPAKVTKESMAVGNMMQKAKPGDRIVVEVKRVSRMNFQGKTENVNVGNVFFNVPLN